MEREVNNGGYHQFFTNSSVQYVPILVESLMRIGCPKTADVTRQAIATLNLNLLTPEATKAKAEQLDERPIAALDALDRQYYSAGESIEVGLLSFIEQNADAIVLPG